MGSNYQTMNSESVIFLKNINYDFFSTDKLRKKLFWTNKKFVFFFKCLNWENFERKNWEKIRFDVWCINISGTFFKDRLKFLFYVNNIKPVSIVSVWLCNFVENIVILSKWHYFRYNPFLFWRFIVNFWGHPLLFKKNIVNFLGRTAWTINDVLGQNLHWSLSINNSLINLILV